MKELVLYVEKLNRKFDIRVEIKRHPATGWYMFIWYTEGEKEQSIILRQGCNLDKYIEEAVAALKEFEKSHSNIG